MSERDSREERMELEMFWLAHRIMLGIKDRLNELAPAYGYIVREGDLKKLLPGLLRKLKEAYKDAFDLTFGLDDLLSAEDCDSLFREASQIYIDMAVCEFLQDIEGSIQKLGRLKMLEEQNLGFSKRVCLANQGTLLAQRSEIERKYSKDRNKANY